MRDLAEWWTMTNQNAIRSTKRWDLQLNEGEIDPVKGILKHSFVHYESGRDSLVAHYLRIYLAMQKIWSQSLIWKNSTCCGATKPMWHSYWAHVPKLWKPESLKTCAVQQRIHHSEKPGHHNSEMASLFMSRERPCISEDPAEPIKKLRKIKGSCKHFPG